MDNTYTFYDIDHKCRFTISNDFFKYNNKEVLERYQIYELMTQYKLATFLHNPMGPAIVYSNGTVAYFLNGKQITGDALETIKFNNTFVNKINE